MDADYCILPNGTIHWLKTPEDYQEAQQIIHDELGESSQPKSGHVVVVADSTHVA